MRLSHKPLTNYKNMNILIFLIITVAARHIRRSVELYSKTGRHVTVSTKLGSTWSSSSEYAQLDFVPIEKGRFVIRGIKSGKFITSTGRKLALTDDFKLAVEFREEIMENNFNKYLTNDGKVLRITSRGKLRLNKASRSTKSISFLSRKTHLKRHFTTGQRL